VLHWLRKSVPVCGVPKKQLAGPKPEDTQTPALQVGCTPYFAQSESSWHWVAVWSTTTVHAELATASSAIMIDLLRPARLKKSEPKGLWRVMFGAG
jgi:hypothetical protein